MSLTEFLLARIAEDEAVARQVRPDEHLHHRNVISLADAEVQSTGTLTVAISSGRVLAECEAKRRIIEFHQNWPVLIEGPSVSCENGYEVTVEFMPRRFAFAPHAHLFERGNQ